MTGTAAQRHSALGLFHVCGSRQRTVGCLWSELRMREQVRASWFPRCFLLIITAHASSVSADRELRPCDEVSARFTVVWVVVVGFIFISPSHNILELLQNVKAFFKKNNMFLFNKYSHPEFTFFISYLNAVIKKMAMYAEINSIQRVSPNVHLKNTTSKPPSRFPSSQCLSHVWIFARTHGPRHAADRLKMRFMIAINTLHNEMTLSAGLHPSSEQPPVGQSGQDYPLMREGAALPSVSCYSRQISVWCGCSIVALSLNYYKKPLGNLGVQLLQGSFRVFMGQGGKVWMLQSLSQIWNTV